MQLRSGVLKQPPQRSCISPYQVFYAEKAPAVKKEGNHQQGELRHILGDMWKGLSDNEREKYEEKFDKQEAKYKEDLLLYYGGSQSDLRKYKSLLEVPEKPRKPVAGCLVYIAENRRTYAAENPDLSTTQVTKYLADKYANLSGKEKKKYEDNFEKQLKDYHQEKEEWTKKYSQKSEQFDALVEEKFKRSVTKQDLEYQELPPHKRQPRKMKDDQETEQQKPEKKQGEKDNKKNTKNTKDEGRGESKKQNEGKDKKDEKKGDRRKSQGRR